MEDCYKPKIHFNFAGKTLCGMRTKKKLTKDWKKVTCRLCPKVNLYS